MKVNCNLSGEIRAAQHEPKDLNWQKSHFGSYETQTRMKSPVVVQPHQIINNLWDESILLVVLRQFIVTAFASVCI